MPTVVYELVEGESRKGLFWTAEGARTRAQEILDGYIDTYRRMRDEGEDLSGAEELTAPDGKLEWALEQHYLQNRGVDDKRFPLGDPVPTAHYSERGHFTVHERVVYS